MHVNIRVFYLTVLFTAMSISSCDWGRTPSKERFEKNCHILIPDKTQVLKDEYQDMLSDYAINYNLKLSSIGTKTLINSIKKSDYYNDSVNSKRAFKENMLKGEIGNQGIWRRVTNGYQFFKHEGGTSYKIELDTINNVFAGWESHGG